MSGYPGRPHQRTPLMQVFKKSSAGVRWVVLVVVAGLGLAAAIGIAGAGLYALVQSNL